MSGLRQHRDLLIAKCTEAIDALLSRSVTLDVGSDDDAVFDAHFELEVTCPSIPQPSTIGCRIVSALNVAGDEVDEYGRQLNSVPVLDQYKARRDTKHCKRCGAAPSNPLP